MKGIKIHHNKILFVAIIILIVFLIILIYFIVKNQKNISDNNNNNIPGECNKDSDCVKVQMGCCPCNMGGKEECVVGSESERYTDLLRNCSKQIICTAMYACNIESCVCVNNKCQAVSSGKNPGPVV